MANIDGKVLRHIREQKKWSQEQLSKKSRVSKPTIQRIETGKAQANRTTAARLAKAFNVSDDQLSGAVPIEVEDEVQGIIDLGTQMNVRVHAHARNAWALVATRYGVSHAVIADFAPLLFLMIAEKSLRQRTARLDTVETEIARVEGSQSDFPHLDGLAFWQRSPSSEILQSERASIGALDLFADLIDGDSLYSYKPANYEEDEDNPFARFLAKECQEFPGLLKWNWCSASSGPDYEIGHDEALRLVGGDEDAAQAVITGQVLLHKLPGDLNQEGRETDRVAWIKEQAASRREKFAELFRGL